MKRDMMQKSFIFTGKQPYFWWKEPQFFGALMYMKLDTMEKGPILAGKNAIFEGLLCK